MSSLFLMVSKSPAKMCLEPVLTKLAVQSSSTDHGEDDGIWHQNDELLRRQPAHVAHRQPEAFPEEPEEQRVDVLQVSLSQNLRWSDACLKFHHFDIQSWSP